MEAKLTVAILTHNEENNIVDCCESVSFADEIIIIDDNSTDHTVELACRYTDKIYTHTLAGNFASQRNYALNLAHNSWVFFVDADERVSEKLKEEIKKDISSNNCSGYYFKRTDYMWGKPVLNGETANIKLLRLAKKEKGRWHNKVHEVWKVNGNIGHLDYPLKHFPHPSVAEFISDVDYYSTVRANELAEQNAGATGFDILAYPAAKFVTNYFFRRGYKDGIPGFLYAMIMSFHSFLVRAKLYQILHK